MSGYELSSISALRSVFPNASFRGCLFHMSQCVWRKIQALGKSVRYANDSDFALQVRMLPALAFVPLMDVIDVFDELVESEYYVKEAQDLRDLVDYFEDNWIGRANGRGIRRIPHFPVDVWNVYEDFNENVSHVGYAVEEWRRRFSKVVGTSHKNLWRFIDSLKAEKKFNEIAIEHFVKGSTNVLKTKKVYRDANERIKNAVNSYGQISNINYLTNISHNINLNV